MPRKKRSKNASNKYIARPEKLSKKKRKQHEKRIKLSKKRRNKGTNGTGTNNYIDIPSQ